MWTSRGVGEYVASEAHTAACGRMYKRDGGTRPIIYFTGGPGDDRDFLTSAASGSHITPVLTDAGFPIISAAFGGAAQWGNATAVTRIGQAWTHVKSLLGTQTDKFIGIGSSKGATALLNYMRANPSDVAAFVGLVPAVSPSDIFDNDRAGLAAEINAAYGGNWASNAATRDPSLNTATHLSQAIPMRLYYGDNDTTVIDTTVTNFAAAVDAEALSVGAFTHLTATPQVDAEELATFLLTYA